MAPDMAPFKGLSAFPITPADPSGRVDTAALRGLIERLATADVDSIGLLGSTGTAVYLTRDERKRAIDAALDQLAGRTPVIVGIGALRTDETIRLGQDAEAAGAAAALLAPVSYAPLTDDEVFTHFATVARSITLPICIYNNPATTHFTFSAALVGRLSALPRVVAVKNPAPPLGIMAEHFADLRQHVPARFSLGSSVDARAIETMLAGGAAWYSVIAGILPSPCVAAVKAVRAGDAAEARRIDAALRPLWDLCVEHSGLRVAYAIANGLGLTSSLPPRPVLPLSDERQRRVLDVVRMIDPTGT